MAGKYPGMSPYGYCRGNPENRIDTDGRTDYFDLSGGGLFRDAIDNGEMRIISTESYYEVLECFGGLIFSSESLKMLESMSYGVGFAYIEGIITPESLLKICEFYNNTDYPLTQEELKEGYMDANNRNGTDPHISVDMEKIKGSSALDNYHNLQSIINDHEGFHITEYIKDPIKYSTDKEYQRERNAVKNQIQSEVWEKTTKRFKQEVIRYYLNTKAKAQ